VHLPATTRSRVAVATLAGALLSGVLASRVLASSPAPTPSHAASPRTPVPTPRVLPSMPDQLLGLEVVREKVSGGLSHGDNPPYLDAMQFFSLREPDKQLEATLEIGHFNGDARIGSAEFEQEIVQQVGATSLQQQLRFGARRVYVTADNGLSLAVWFNGRDLFVLSMRSAFSQPKALIRAALQVRP
jgi:hypothetical protein